MTEVSEQEQLETENRRLVEEAEESLGEREVKRKRHESPQKRRSKKRKLAKLVGWGGKYQPSGGSSPAIHPTGRAIHP